MTSTPTLILNISIFRTDVPSTYECSYFFPSPDACQILAGPDYPLLDDVRSFEPSTGKCACSFNEWSASTKVSGTICEWWLGPTCGDIWGRVDVLPAADDFSTILGMNGYLQIMGASFKCNPKS